jgi:hypothetical protein
LTIKRLFAAILAVSLFTIAVRETLDPDMWWHLRTGQIILDAGIPRQDIFSFTVPANQWIAHEWLSEVFMWVNFQISGLIGLMLLFAAIVAAAFMLVYFRCEGRPYLAGFVVLLAALASAPLWGVRPQMFNLLFSAIFVFLLEGFKDNKIGRRALWLLPLLTAVWANLHSGYLLGIVLLGTYLVGDSLSLLLGSRSDRRLDWSELRWLALMTLLCLLAAALNPNGPSLWVYPFFTLGSSFMQSNILEWQSPNFHLQVFWPYIAILVLGVLSWPLSGKRPALTDALLFCGTAVAGLISVRHIPIFAVVAAPIISRHLVVALIGTRFFTLVSGQTSATKKNRLAVLNWAILLAVGLAAALWITSVAVKNESEIARRYPVAAVDYLQENNLDTQRGYNSYKWGGYLIWRHLPVFVDGRADVYGDDFLSYYRRTLDLEDNWQEPLDDFDVQYVLVEQSSHLATLLDSVETWQETFRDNVSVIFVRAG